jgi:hypothetical protein
LAPDRGEKRERAGRGWRSGLPRGLIAFEERAERRVAVECRAAATPVVTQRHEERYAERNRREGGEDEL